MSKTHHLDSLWDLFTIWVVMLGGVIVAFMLAIIGTVHTSLLPLRLLTQASVSVGEGNYNATLPVVGISEVRPTIQAFNSMVVNLRLLTGHLSDVVNHIEEAKEEQNRTIARELHDNLGGTLTMIKMGIDSLNEDLSADEYTHEKLESLMEMAGSAIRMTRAITQGLRPPMLDTLGLGPTIEWYVGEFSRMSNIECLVHVSVGIHLSELMTIGLLRIVQEGLNNIAKHAEATYVSVLATSEAPGELTLMISDNGKGVEDRPSKSISSGLLGMRERIHRMGGTFLLNRATGSIGTSILIKVPTA